MKGALTILEGAEKGSRKPLTSALLIVGRSKNADLQIEDELVSRRHLEIRVEADAVFVENKSTQGSLLNGKPLLGVVSLNSGDVLEIGSTKLRFDEISDPARPVESAPDEAVSSGIDGTRAADSVAEQKPRKREAPAADETRAIVDDGTRMLNPSELPNWVAHEKIEKKAAGKGGIMFAFIAIILALVGGAGWFFFMRGGTHDSSGGLIQYKDALYAFDLQRPLDWSKTADDSNIMGFGFGKDGGNDWGRLNIYTDKNARNGLTGLSDGFQQYQEVLKKRYKDFELNGSKVIKIHNATVVFYGFSSPTVYGKGIYLLNGDSRINVECSSPSAVYDKYSSAYSSILQSFHLNDVDAQQFFDYPSPDEGMQQLALANPAELSREVDEHAARGDMFMNSRDVNPESLYTSIQEYRKALQLAKAAAQELPAYQPAARSLAAATKIFNQALERQRFEISRALNDGDTTAAYWGANKMMQMVPDKVDPAYQEAYKIIRSLPTPK